MQKVQVTFEVTVSEEALKLLQKLDRPEYSTLEVKERRTTLLSLEVYEDVGSTELLQPLITELQETRPAPLIKFQDACWHPTYELTPLGHLVLDWAKKLPA